MLFLPRHSQGAVFRPAFDRGEVRRIAGQAGPITMVSLVNMGMSVTDTLMSASLGATALAGVAVASDFYTLLFMLLAGTLSGMSPLYAGSSARSEAGRLSALRNGGWLIFAGGCVILAPSLLYAPRLFGVLGVDPAIVEAGQDYGAIMAFTLVPNAAVAVFRSRLVAIERPGLILRATLAAVPLNAVGNYVFMFGIGGWAGFGVAGLAVSSLLVWSAIALMLAVWSRRVEAPLPHAAPSLDSTREILAIGLPIGVMTLAEAGVFLGATLYSGTFSPEAAAAHAIAIRLGGISYSISVGLNQATMVRVARQQSESGRQSTISSALVLAAFCAVSLSVTLLLVAALLSLLGPGFGDLRQAASIAVPAVALLALMELMAPLGATADGALRAHGDTRAAMVFSIAGNWLVAVPAIVVLTRVYDFGVAGLWAGLAFGVLTSAILMGSRLQRHWRPWPELQPQDALPC